MLSIVPLSFLWLLPSRTQIEQVQKAIQFQTKMGEMTQAERDQEFARLDPNVVLSLGLTASYKSLGKFNGQSNVFVPSDSIAGHDSEDSEGEIYGEKLIGSSRIN